MATDATTTPYPGRSARVLVTGAAGNIAYSIVFGIGRGQLLGRDQKIELVLLDIPPMADKIEGVRMELEDCAFPLLSKIVATTDYKEAFANTDVALLIGAKPRGPGMDRSNLLRDNAGIFRGQGLAINEHASKDIKVVVVGNPANTNALIAATNAPSIPKANFTAMTRLDQNRAKAQLAKRLDINPGDVGNVVIWGNHSKTQYVDPWHGKIGDKPISQAVGDDEWMKGEFLSTVQMRGSAIIKARGGLSSAASAANACLDHARDWILGTAPGEIVSMGIVSDGSYNIPEGIVYSFPVTCANGQYAIVQGLEISDFSRQSMDASAAELLEERKVAGIDA